MPTVLLVRHGRTAANAAAVLAGRSPGIDLDDTGRAQAERLAGRLSSLPLHAAVTSPLERCRQTAEVLLGRGGTRAVPRPEAVVEHRLAECDYGEWTGQELRTLAKHPMWKVVQGHPSAATFPGGESLRDVQHRSVAAVREHDALVAAQHGEDALWLAVAHGDVLKSVLADALGSHLDEFQRIVVDPCSVSVVRYTALRPFVVRMNSAGDDLGGLVPTGRRRRRRAAPASSDAVVGGGGGGAR